VLLTETGAFTFQRFRLMLAGNIRFEIQCLDGDSIHCWHVPVTGDAWRVR